MKKRKKRSEMERKNDAKTQGRNDGHIRTNGTTHRVSCVHVRAAVAQRLHGVVRALAGRRRRKVQRRAPILT